MGIVKNEQVAPDCLLGMWEIKEDFNTLYSKVRLGKEEISTLDSFKNYSRKVEWLSVRVLLNEMTQKSSKIVYNEEHKPFLDDNSYNISISHSYRLTSVLLSKNKRVGIDLEYMTHRIRNIAHKFINEDEVISSDPSIESLHLYVHWCAKEALYKICDKNNINFKTNLTVRPFLLESRGLITGVHHDENIYEEYPMNYIIQDNYVIVHCCK
ncbi:MAG TPA: 4'-phosphopantetheinyl transferase superfamily protein [Bacteroidales bacterium]|nr:4'-phosphopantetheinyl transferase superfamily protein [Bacteroidales bacterium]